jgi:hypothetical protein
MYGALKRPLLCAANDDICVATKTAPQTEVLRTATHVTDKA